MERHVRSIFFLPYRCLDCRKRFFQLRWLWVRGPLLGVRVGLGWAFRILKSVKAKRVPSSAELAAGLLRPQRSDDPPVEASS